MSETITRLLAWLDEQAGDNTVCLEAEGAKAVRTQAEEITRLRAQVDACVRQVSKEGRLRGAAEYRAEAAEARVAALEKAREALRLGREMRAKQTAYFRDRTKDNLVASKVAEAAFDKAVSIPDEPRLALSPPTNENLDG